MSWTCHTCAEVHEGDPLSFAADYPDKFANMSGDQRDLRAVIGSDQCIIDEKEFYIRGCLEIPIKDSEEIFLWGLWAIVYEDDYDDISDSWEEEGRENTRGPYKGRLANSIREYLIDTFNLKLTVRLRPLGERPLFFIDEKDHPLAVQQREGLTLDEAHAMASSIMHPAPRAIH